VKVCHSCAEPIRWVRTVGGKRMPVDLATDSNRGNVLIALIGGEEIGTVLVGNELASARANHEPLYLSHFATCPNAAQHRRTA